MRESGRRRRSLLTLAEATILSKPSLAHFRFMPGSGKSSHDIFTYPFSPTASSVPIPESGGGVADHRTPASKMNLCTAAGVFSGRWVTGTTTVLFAVTGWDSFPYDMERTTRGASLVGGWYGSRKAGGQVR